MGVKGDYLSHVFIKGVTEEVDLKTLRGQTGAYDSSKWLHAGCRIAARLIALQQHEQIITEGYDAESMAVAYAIKTMLNLKSNCGINPVAVIDGCPLPTKEKENQQRVANRKKAYAEAKAAEAKGDLNDAEKLYMKACGVSTRMKFLLMEECMNNEIDYVQSRHEADSQMVILVERGVADFAITEDGDLLALGCRRTLFKLDVKKFTGQEVLRDKLFNDDKSGFNGFNPSMLTLCNILQGNDYSGIIGRHYLFRIIHVFH